MLARQQTSNDIPLSYPVGPRWFVFYTYIHREKLAEREIFNLGFPVHVPFEKRISKRLRRKQRIYETPLFPRYGFVYFDIDRDDWGSIVNCDGVCDLLRMNRIPQSVPQSMVDGLRLAENIGVFDHTRGPKAGMDVELTDGPFAGFIAKVLRARSAEKVDVLLNFLGGERIVTSEIVNMREI